MVETEHILKYDILADSFFRAINKWIANWSERKKMKTFYDHFLKMASLMFASWTSFERSFSPSKFTKAIEFFQPSFRQKEKKMAIDTNFQ